MKTIWKFPLAVGHVQKIEMPADAVILTSYAQSNEPMLWAIVDTEKQKEIRYFEIFGTGHPMPELEKQTRTYINSIQVDNGLYVFHIFELKP